MPRFCEECPAAQFIVENIEQDDRDLAVNVAQGLSARFVGAVRGTKGLTDERVEEIRLKDIKFWRDSEESELLQSQPELAKAVYGCEEKVTILGTCALHSVQRT
jgi:hypothetical protein